MHVTIDGIRLHLRTDEKKLWINGQYVLYLNNEANFIVKSFIQSCYETTPDYIVWRTVDKMVRHYRISRMHAAQDLNQVIGIIRNISHGQLPTHMVGMKVVNCEETKAPNRMDLCLTYRCNNDCSHCYLSKTWQQDTGMFFDVDGWKRIIDKLWKIGIPQLVFTGGECTLREELPELIRHAKHFVTGIITNGTLITSELADDLKSADLDWIQITLDSSKAAVHDKMQNRKGAYKETIMGIKNSIVAGLNVSINMTLTKRNHKDLNSLLTLAKKLGVRQVSTNALINSGKGINARKKEGLSESALKKVLLEAKAHAKKIGVELNWFLPTCYKNLNPMELGFGQRACSACSTNMTIQPDGSVIPCQSWTHETLGNIINDKWEKIWNHPTAQKLRSNSYAPDTCRSCDKIDTCGGGCPLDHLNGGKRISCTGGAQ
jgi:radical SAM protein with 4Fe4S-binding SPASM domain